MRLAWFNHRRPLRDAAFALLLGQAQSCMPAAAMKVQTKTGKDPKCFGIVDGQATAAFPATVALVITKRSGDGTYFNCTGTFIGDNVLITAAHCIPSSGPQDFFVATNGQTVEGSADAVRSGIAATSLYFDARRKPDGDGMLDDPSQPRSSDVAMAIFPAGTAKSWATLGTKRVDPGTEVTLVGYGHTDLDGAATVGRTKRSGKNQIAKANDQFQTDGLYQVTGWAHPGEAARNGAATSVAAPGDSGGPLLVNNTIVGIDVSGISDRKQTNLQPLSAPRRSTSMST